MNLVLTKKLHPCSAHKKSFLYNPFSPFYWYKILWYEWTLRSYLKGFNRYFQGLTVRHVKSHYSQNYVFVKRLSSFSLEFHWWNSWSVLSNAVKCDGRGTLIPLQQLSIATTKRMVGRCCRRRRRKHRWKANPIFPFDRRLPFPMTMPTTRLPHFFGSNMRSNM